MRQCKVKTFMLLAVVLVWGGGALSARPAQAQNTTYEKILQKAHEQADEKQYDAALASLKVTLELAKTAEQKVPVLLGMGQVYEAQQQTELARNTWRQVLLMKEAPDKDKLSAQAAIAISYYNSKDLVEARNQFYTLTAFAEKVGYKTTDVIDLRWIPLFIAQTYSEEKDYEQAREELAVLATSTSKKHSPILILMAQLHIADTFIKESKFEQARQQWESILKVKQSPDLLPEEKKGIQAIQVTAQLSIAESFLQEKQYLKAQEEYHKVLNLKEADPTAKEEAKKQLEHIATLIQ